MPSCIVRYRAQLLHMPSGKVEGEAEILVEEAREPDELGDPGRLVWRKVVEGGDPRSAAWIDLVRRSGAGWRFKLLSRIGPITWAELAAP